MARPPRQRGGRATQLPAAVGGRGSTPSSRQRLASHIHSISSGPTPSSENCSTMCVAASVTMTSGLLLQNDGRATKPIAVHTRAHTVLDHGPKAPRRHRSRWSVLRRRRRRAEEQLAAGVIQGCEADLVELCRRRHSSTYAEAGTMPMAVAGWRRSARGSRVRDRRLVGIVTGLRGKRGGCRWA